MKIKPSNILQDVYFNTLYFSQVPDDIMCCQFSSDGTELAIGMVNGTVQVITKNEYIYIYRP